MERGGLGSHCPHLGLVLRKSLVMSTAVLLATEKTGQLVLLSILVRFLPFFNYFYSKPEKEMLPELQIENNKNTLYLY